MFSYSFSLKAQVTIGSSDAPDQSAILELKPEKSNLGFKGPDVELKNIYDISVIKKPAIGLLVFNTTNSDDNIPNSEKVSRNKYYYWTGTQWTEATDINGVEENIENTISGMGIPQPAIFTLDGSDYIYSSSTHFPKMKGIENPFDASPSMALPLKEEINQTSGKVILDAQQKTITLKPGIYDISFSYELIPTVNQSPPCDYPLYYMEFPSDIISNGNVLHQLIRIDSGASVKGKLFSDHGNTINYVATIYEETIWNVKFAINPTTTACGKRNYYSMPNRSTYLYISRIGESK